MKISEVRKISKIKTTSVMNQTQLMITPVPVNDKSKVMDPNIVAVNKSGLSLGINVMRDLFVSSNDYLRLGVVGSQLYIAKCPKGVAGCRITKAKSSIRYSIFSQQIQRDFQGQFQLGESVDQEIKNADGHNVKIVWRHLIRNA